MFQNTSLTCKKCIQEASIAIYGWKALHAKNPGRRCRSYIYPGAYLDVLSLNRITADDDGVKDLRVNLQDYTRSYGPTLGGIERRNVPVGTSIINNTVYEATFWRNSAETRTFLEFFVSSLKYVVAGETVAER